MRKIISSIKLPIKGKPQTWGLFTRIQQCFDSMVPRLRLILRDYPRGETQVGLIWYEIVRQWEWFQGYLEKHEDENKWRRSSLLTFKISFGLERREKMTELIASWSSNTHSQNGSPSDPGGSTHGTSFWQGFGLHDWIPVKRWSKQYWADMELSLYIYNSIYESLSVLGEWIYINI